VQAADVSCCDVIEVVPQMEQRCQFVAGERLGAEGVDGRGELLEAAAEHRDIVQVFDRSDNRKPLWHNDFRR
jgi:hypothetical protein